MKIFFTILASLFLGFAGALAIILCCIFIVAFFTIMHFIHLFAFIIIICGGIVCVKFGYFGLKTVFKKN